MFAPTHAHQRIRTNAFAPTYAHQHMRSETGQELYTVCHKIIVSATQPNDAERHVRAACSFAQAHKQTSAELRAAI